MLFAQIYLGESQSDLIQVELHGSSLLAMADAQVLCSQINMQNEFNVHLAGMAFFGSFSLANVQKLTLS